MAFYLLAFVVAFATIFGLIHSQKARERLYLQSFYVWSLEAIHNHIQQYEAFNTTEENSDDNDILEFFEITVDETDAPKLEKTHSSESVEEVEGIRLRAEDANVQRTSEYGSSSSQQQESSDPAQRKIIEGQDNVLAAINASLQKLSQAANSGKINGAQLYDILVQETLLYDKAIRQQRKLDAENSKNSTPVIEELDENEAREQERPKMYFGESPIEYVPHQK